MAGKFEFFGVPRIVFGRGEARRLGEIVRPLGSAAAVVYNGAERGDGGALDVALDSLAAAGVTVKLLYRQRGEPTVDHVDSATHQARQNGCDVVIGLGGGSPIDAAKAVAGLLGNGGSAVDYMEVVGKGQKITRPAAPWVAVPTTAGTGAEVTRNAVVGLPEKKFKASIRSEHLLPRVALVDPELGVRVPPPVTAASGMDALCQLIESFTSTGAQPITDVLALEGIPLVARALRRAYGDGADLAAREDMATAALFSGITLTNAGLGAVHGFAAPLGANFPAPHGVVCAALLPHVISANIAAMSLAAKDPAAGASLVRYAHVGRALTNDISLSDAEAIGAAAVVTSDLARDLNIPPLGQFGITQQDVPAMVALARKASSMRYNPVVLSDEALERVLRAAL